MDLLNIVKENVTLDSLYQVFCFLVVIDVITGVIKAWKSGSIKSRTLRNGLFSSMGELILLLMCVIASNLIPITHLIVYSIIVIMVLKELTSILENLIEIGVEIPSFLVKGLKVYSDKLDNESEEK